MRGAGATTLAGVLQQHLRQRPQAPLLFAPEAGRQLSYATLARHSQQLGAWLQAQGISPGQRVALFLHNGQQTTSLFLSTMVAGYVVTPLNLLAHKTQLAWVIEHCEAKVLFTCRAHEAQLAQALTLVRQPPRVVVIDVDAPDLFISEPAPGPGASAASLHLQLPSLAPHQAALLMYTSGTTGTPKGVLLSHANLVASASAVARWHELGPADRCLSALPLYHINGQVIGTLAPFVAGGSIVSPHRFSASAWWSLVQDYGCTWINMVPTIVAYLLNAPATSTPQRFATLRFGRCASAPLPPEQQRAFEQRFGVPIIEAMGMTESASTVFCNPHDTRRRYGSPGLPCGVEAGVIAPDGQFLGAEQEGEIVLRGPNVMAGYYKAADKTAQAFTGDGWLKTGDLGRRDADGFYFITGRLKELIIKGGENIAPREIDEVLLRHPAVLEAAAFGIADPAYGQDIAAALVLKPGASAGEAELLAFAQQELGRYKAPRWIRLLPDLPKGPSGKVQRLKLQELGAPGVSAASGAVPTPSPASAG